MYFVHEIMYQDMFSSGVFYSGSLQPAAQTIPRSPADTLFIETHAFASVNITFQNTVNGWHRRQSFAQTPPAFSFLLRHPLLFCLQFRLLLLLLLLLKCFQLSLHLRELALNFSHGGVRFH